MSLIGRYPIGHCCTAQTPALSHNTPLHLSSLQTLQIVRVTYKSLSHERLLSLPSYRHCAPPSSPPTGTPTFSPTRHKLVDKSLVQCQCTTDTVYVILLLLLLLLTTVIALLNIRKRCCTISLCCPLTTSCRHHPWNSVTIGSSMSKQEHSSQYASFMTHCHIYNETYMRLLHHGSSLSSRPVPTSAHPIPETPRCDTHPADARTSSAVSPSHLQ